MNNNQLEEVSTLELGREYRRRLKEQKVNDRAKIDPATIKLNVGDSVIFNSIYVVGDMSKFYFDDLAVSLLRKYPFLKFEGIKKVESIPNEDYIILDSGYYMRRMLMKVNEDGTPINK